MKRTAIWIGALALMITAYGTGYWHGRSAPLAEEGRTAAIAGHSEHPTADDHALSGSSVGPVAGDPYAQADALLAQGRLHEALALVETQVAGSTADSRARFLLADLRQMTGDTMGALEPLIEVLAVPPTPEAADRARRRLELLVNAREQQLANTGELAALVTLFEHLVALEPAWDGHRLKLARWLSRSGELDRAERELAEIGYTGVTAAELEGLAREIEQTRSRPAAGLALERERDALFTRAQIGDARRPEAVRLLVDTGATMTGIAVRTLDRLGARQVEDAVPVRTANGIVRLPVYEVPLLRVGGAEITGLRVLGFSDLPMGADGLLGMDVLSQLSGTLPGMVGRPEFPR